MLVDQYRIAVGVHNDKAADTATFGQTNLCWLQSFGHQVTMYIAHICERVHFTGVLIPTGVKRQHVVVKHALKYPNKMIAVLENQIVVIGIPTKRLEPQLFIKTAATLQDF